MSTKAVVSLVLSLFLFGFEFSIAEQSTLDQAQLSQMPFRHAASAEERTHASALPNPQQVQLPVYFDFGSAENHFFPTGFMGDYSDVLYNGAYRKEPHSGSTCIKLVYKDKASQGARWAGMFWQHPAYNWGNLREKGINLTGASKLVFWARGDKGGERVESFKVGGLNGLSEDSCEAQLGPVVLDTQWRKYEIDLNGKDLSSINGGFAWTMNLDYNPSGAVFYLDDIYFS